MKFDLILLKKGTIVHIEGIPFALAEDTRVQGNAANLSLLRHPFEVVGEGEWSQPEGIQ